jgi:hypothetical protein
MRRLSAALVALTAAVALSALSAPAWAAPPKAKPKPKVAKVKERPLVVSPSQVHSGQSVKVSGGGCQGASALEFGVDGQGFHRRTAKGGDWSYEVELPDGLRYGDHHMTAQCKGVKHTPARFHLSRERRSKGSFSVSPDVVIAGDKVWVDGNGCKKRTAVAITLNGKPIKWLVSDRYGSFDKKVRIPKWAKRGRNVVSAFCGRHLGYDVIKVKNPYRQHHDGVHFNKNKVRPGHGFQVDGDDCPDGKPYGHFNGKPVKMNSSRKGKGFTANAEIPKGTPAGIHKFRAGCEGGSRGETNLYVEDEEDEDGYSWDEQNASRAFGPQRSSDLAMWAGLLVGIALLVASTVITTRRRRNHG